MLALSVTFYYLAHDYTFHACLLTCCPSLLRLVYQVSIKMLCYVDYVRNVARYVNTVMLCYVYIALDYDMLCYVMLCDVYIALRYVTLR